MNLITVATLAAELGIAPRLVQYRAKRLGVEKTSGIYLFTPEQADAIRQYKTKPGPAPGRMREAKVRVLAVQSNERKLLTIQKDDTPEFVATDEHVEQHVFQKWNEVLRRLAQL